MFVIRRTDQGGGYVAKPGSEHSYTPLLRNAQKFRTREEADRNRCVMNEVVEDLERLLDMVRR